MATSRLVWIIEENTYGYIIEQHAFFSLVAYEVDGIIVKAHFDNENLLEWERYSFDYE
jgi:hypothetical protein